MNSNIVMFTFLVHWQLVLASAPAPVEADRCLIQQQFKTGALQIKTVEHHTAEGVEEEDLAMMFEDNFHPYDAIEAHEGITIDEEDTSLTGNDISIDFDLWSADMETVTRKYVENWQRDPVTNITTKVMKPYLEALIAPKDRGQIVSAYFKERVRMFGFNITSVGLSNINGNRYWTAEPGTERAYLIHAIQILNVPEIPKWTYTVTFASGPPEGLMMFPRFHTTRRTAAGHCYVVFVCPGAVPCEDESIQIASLSLSPKEEEMPKPEEVEPINANISSSTAMYNQTSGELANDAQSTAKM
mmetsp:Transcript_97953/g.179006  ORF Transcript_97953/g.179006 Transcript_97953/m.179006 type:complete len:300 (+) Transcript_97953:79-978(+)